MWVMARFYQFFLVFSLLSFGVLAQPTKMDLNDSSFTFNGFSNGTQTTYPNSFAAYQCSTPVGPNSSTNFSAQYALRASSTSNQAQGVKNHVSFGISMYMTNDNQNYGAFVTVLDASLRDSIRVKFKSTQFVEKSGFENTLRLQYRIGNSGSWVNVLDGSDTVQYVTGLNSTAPEDSFDVILPAETWGQETLQIRWIYYQSQGPTGIGLRDRMTLDDIEISSRAWVPALRSDWRGATLTNATDSVDFDTLAGGVSEYQLNILGGAAQVQHLTDRKFCIFSRYNPDLSGFQYGGTYDVFLRAIKYRTSDTIQTVYGDTFSVTMPSTVPTITLEAADCNSSVSTPSEKFSAQFVGLANGYVFRYISPSDDTSFVTNTNWVNTANLSNIGPVPGNTYQVAVRAVAPGTTSSFGANCNVTWNQPTIAAQFKPNWNPGTLSSYNEMIELWPVGTATGYRILVLNAGLTQIDSFDITKSRFKVSFRTAHFGSGDSVASIYVPNTTYRFRAQPLGSFSGPAVVAYGSDALITMPASNDMRVGQFDDPLTSSLEGFNDILFYPNPTRSNLIYYRSADIDQIESIQFYDLQGKRVEGVLMFEDVLELPENSKSGLYLIRTNFKNGESRTTRMMVQMN